MRGPTLEVLVGGVKPDLARFARCEGDRGCGAKFDAVGEVHFHTHLLDACVGGVFDGAAEGVGGCVIRNDQADAVAYLIEDLVQGESRT